ncbi:MAG TPA: bacteriocin fulvocin C-related protein [Longimicrobium sp.]|nr:bacteriocin fulvocin C-related protein [Longimicrobium sp.]
MRKRILLPAGAVLLTAMLGTAAPRHEPPACVVAARWVRAHHDRLPTTLAEYARYDQVHRRAIYDALPPATRQAMWRQHLDGYLRPGSPLTEPQKAAVRDAMTYLPVLTVNNPDRAVARGLRDRLSTQFDRALLRRVFFKLGPAPAAPADAGKRPLCDCDTDGDCSSGTVCKPLLCSFTTGCGIFGSDTCTGVCRLP